MNLINSIQEIQKYIVVSSSFDFDRAKPYIRKAQNKYIIPLISKGEYDYFIAEKNDVLESKRIVRELIEEACVNLAFHLGFSSLAVHFTNYGIVHTELQEVKQSEWAEKRDLHRSFIRDGNQALDDALREMEYYLDCFPHWRKSPSFTVLNESFNKHTGDFQKWFNIGNSRQTFLALKPAIREIKERYFLPMLGEGTIELIKAKTTNTVIYRALELCQKAEVALTIANATKTGIFEIEEAGMFLSRESLPWERSKKHLASNKFDQLSDQKQRAGEEYLKKLKRLISENLTLFPNYEFKPNSLKTKLIKKRSGLAI